MQTSSILLVEDSEDDAYFFAHSLKSSGLPGTLHHAPDGSAAIDFLSKAWESQVLPKVIFLDLKMPVLNGFEVLTWLQKQPFFKQLLVYVLSGSEHPSDKERAAQLGATGYLVKPITLSDLRPILAKSSTSEAEKSANEPSGTKS